MTNTTRGLLAQTDWTHSIDASGFGRGAEARLGGAPDAWLEVNPTFARGLFGIATGDEVIVVTWLHRADRDVLEVRPARRPRSPARLGVHHTVSPSTEPVGATSRDRARDLGNPVCGYPDRSRP